MAAVVAVVAVLVLAPATASAFPLWGDHSVGVTQHHQVLMLQGDDPSSDPVSPREQVMVVERTFWSIPWDSTEVYTYVSPQARNVTVDNVRSISHQGGAVFVPGDFSRTENPEDPPSTGWMEGSGYDGYYYWRFPGQASRDLLHPLAFESDQDFGDADPEFTQLEDWNVTDGSLSLAEDVDNATWVSKRYTGGVGIVSVNLTVNATSGANMTFQVSADNGTSWVDIDEGTVVELDRVGREFRWRVSVERATDDTTPVLDGALFDIVFTPEFTDIWLETTYYLEMAGGEASFDMTFPFDISTSTFIFVGHADPDVELVLEGAQLTRSPSSSIPGKVTYTHMGGERAVILAFTVTDAQEGDDGSTPPWFYIVVLALIVLMAVGIAKALRPDEAGGEAEGEVEGEAEGEAEGEGENGHGVDDDGEVDEVEGDAEDLEERKRRILEGIQELDGDHEIGLIDDGEHEARRAELKAEAVEVMRRLDDDG